MPPRLLFATTVPVTLRAFLAPLAEHFRRLGWRVDALAAGATACPECRRGFDHVFDAPWSRRLATAGNLRAAAVVRRLMQEQDYDLVHVHTPIAAFATRWALRNLRRQGRPRVIYTAHGFHFVPGGRGLSQAAYRWAERLAGRWTDALVVINRADFEAANRLRIVPADAIEWMPGIGVDCRRYRRAAIRQEQVDSLRAELGLSPAAVLLTCVAELSPNKRHADLLHAVAGAQRHDVHLALAGEGPLVRHLQQLAERLGIASRTHFLGYRRDVPALVCASRAAVLCSEREGLPRSVLESLALETPVIGTRARGTADLLSAGGGALVDVGDVAGLTAAIIRLVDRPGEAAAMGRIGRAIALKHDLTRVIAQHEILYRRLLDGSTVRASAA